MPPAGFLGAGPPWPQYGQQKPKQPQYAPQPASYPQTGQYQQVGQYQPPGQYQQPVQYQQPGQYQQPDQYQQAWQYQQSSQYQQPGHFQQSSQYQQLGQWQQPSQDQYGPPYDPNQAAQRPFDQQKYVQPMHHPGVNGYATQQGSNTPQWGHQYAAQQNHVHQGSAQAHNAQLYPGQNYQQQGFEQNSTMQPVYAQATSAPATDSNSTCYNCGQTGHWAMHCPYPRAAQPPGANAQLRKPKKFRPNYIPPVVTKYEVPAHVQKAHMAAIRGTAPAHPYSANSASTGQQHIPGAQVQGGLAPPTPLSANSSGYSQVCGPPPSASPHVVAPRVTAPYTPQASPHNSTYGQNIPPPPPPESPASQVSSSMKLSNPQVPKTVELLPFNTLPQKPGTDNEIPANPILHTGVTAVSNNIALKDQTQNQDLSDDGDEETDDLSLLDIPDLPTEDPAKYGHQPCRLISTPLQAFSASDKPNLIPEPSKDSTGTIVSRYLRPNTLNSMLENVRRSKHYSQKMDDPIFQFRVESNPSSPGAPPPPPPPPGPESTHNGFWQRAPRKEIQYRTVSNGPAPQIPRESTPVPQVETSDTGPAEYDPFNPAAGFPDDVCTASTAKDLSSYDPWSLEAEPPPNLSHEGTGVQHHSQNGINNHGHQQGSNPKFSRSDRKRSYADSFADDHQPYRKNKHNVGIKKRGGNQSNAYGRRR